MEGLFQKTYRSISEHICVNGLETTCTKEFAKLDSNLARVGYLLKLTEKTRLFEFAPSKTKKDLPKAQSLKVAGNKYFQQKKYSKALEAYNHALRLVPILNNDGLLALCFSNRSAALFSMQKYEYCLADIKLAITFGYPDESLYKLLTRRAKCHQYVDVAMLNDSIQTALASLDTSGLTSQGKQPWKREIEKLSAKSHSVHAFSIPELRINAEGSETLSCSATVKQDNEYGRFIQAVEDINSGDVVLVERPFCSVPLPACFLTHCGHCQLRVDHTLYPCRSCGDVVYCGKNCEEVAWHGYHSYECDFILTIKAVDVNMGHLSLRSALQAGYETVESVLTGDFEKLRANKAYANIYNLEGHILERSGKDMFWRTVSCVVLAHMCDLDQWAGSSDNTLKTLATAVLHHMDTFPCNAHEISEIIYDSGDPCKSSLVEIGAGIYQTLSMFNHSCDPSVVRTFYKGNTCVMNALSPIQKLEQIYDNYGCLYATHDLTSRQTKLQSQYYFQCCCSACVHDWALYDQMQYHDSPVYKCYDCHMMMLPPYGDECDQCHKPFDKKIVDEMLGKAKEQFDVLVAQLFAGKNPGCTDMTDIANKLQGYSQLVNRLVFRPYKTLNDCQEALKHVYSLMGNAVVKS